MKRRLLAVARDFVDCDEFESRPESAPKPSSFPYAAALRQELSFRNLEYAQRLGLPFRQDFRRVALQRA